MGIDISQFLETFYEESFEGLDVMEAALLSMDGGTADDETINEIFRAAHSIKGGSGTFGLKDVSDFTHVLETLLDEMRSGQRPVTSEAVALLLTSTDVVREMLTCLRAGDQPDSKRVGEVHAELQAMLEGQAAPGGVEKQAAVPAVEASGWRIDFTPHLHLFKTGNDPCRILKELAGLGDIEVTADLSRLPPLADLDAEECHLGWTVTLSGDVALDDIKEVFAWVEDDCDLTIVASEQSSAAPADAKEVTVSPDGAQPAAPAAKAPAEATAATAPAKAQKPAGGASRPAAGDAGSIRVSIDKVDALINMVGELVITQSMLNQLGADFTIEKLQNLQEGLAELERHTRELQENVMRIRMLPISFSFNRFLRLVHDLSQKLNKKVNLKVSGEQTELDKTVMEKIGDPLVHLVRNSLDHGIESPEVRRANGKPEVGTLHLNAYHQGGNIVIEIRDDGAGLNAEKILKKAVEKGLVAEGEQLPMEKIHELIFQPGFSTAEQLSDVSGRGVGMDVVIRNIKDLGGSVDVQSELGVGTTFTVRLPLTLAILDGQLVRIGNETYVIPLVSITESLQVKGDQVKSIAGGAELYRLRDDYVPVVRLHDLFSVEPDTDELVGGLLVVVEGDSQSVGLFVDELLGQQQVVIKSLESNFKRVEGLSGATILGDGTVALIIDIPGLVKVSRNLPGDRRGPREDTLAA